MAPLSPTLRLRARSLTARLGAALALLAPSVAAATLPQEVADAQANKPAYAEPAQPAGQDGRAEQPDASADQPAGEAKHSKQGPKRPQKPKKPKKPEPDPGNPGGGDTGGTGPGVDPGGGEPPVATPATTEPSKPSRRLPVTAPQPASPQQPQSVAPPQAPRAAPSPKRTQSRRARPAPRAPAAGRAVRDAAAGGGVKTSADSSASTGGRSAPAKDHAAGGGGQKQDDGSPVTRTVRDIVHEVPEPVKMALAALAALSLMLAGGSLFSAARARRLDRHRAELLREVGLLQTALLPPVPEKVGALRTSVAYRPAEGPGAGGDFYDALTLPGSRAAFILGDVSGHGRQALARTAFMRYTLRAYLEAGLEPRAALQVAGRVIEGNLDGNFATLVLAVHDPSTGSLTYACAGHPAPILVGPSVYDPVLASSSPPIGVGLRTGLRQTTIPLVPGSLACLYTDGLAEARTENGVLGRGRLTDLVAELGEDAGAEELLARVANESRLISDDMAAVLVRPTAGVPAGGFRTELLELDGADVEGPRARRFLNACGVEPHEATRAEERARAARRGSGGAVLYVSFGIRAPRVEVLPRNVESIQAASLRVGAGG